VSALGGVNIRLPAPLMASDTAEADTTSWRRPATDMPRMLCRPGWESWRMNLVSVPVVAAAKSRSVGRKRSSSITTLRCASSADPSTMTLPLISRPAPELASWR